MTSSKRIEAAESSALKIIYSVSLTTEFQMDICQRLLSSDERFDRVVLDKKIDSRETYFKNLAKQVVLLEDLSKKSRTLGIALKMPRIKH